MTKKRQEDKLKKIGIIIRHNRRAKNITQNELIKKIQTTRAHLIDIEKGRTNLSFSVLYTILKKLKISNKDILEIFK